MYCPNCGSNNQPGINFCTRCGTNLTIVSAALAGNAGGAGGQLEQMPGLLKRYYSGRYQMMLGAGSLLAGVGLGALLLMGGHWSWLFWVFLWSILGLFGYGARNFTKGWTEWSESSVELKALRSGAAADGPPRLSSKDVEGPKAARAPEFLAVDASTPVQPPSVTEATTRHLGAEKIERE